MSDTNSLAMILLAEASIILLIALIVVLWLQIKSRNKQSKAVEQLVSQIKEQLKTRTDETESFLKEFYGLSNSELTVATKAICTQEKLLLQNIVDALIRSEYSQITNLDTSVNDLVNTYKNLIPKPVEAMTDDLEEGLEVENNSNNLDVLRAENEALTEELGAMHEKILSITSEFSGMFGGVKKDDLGTSDGIDKIDSRSDSDKVDGDLDEPSEKDISDTTANQTEITEVEIKE